MMLFSCVVLFKDKISKFVIEVNETIKVNIISIIAISILTAILAALLGTAKWPNIDAVHTETNALNLILSKYLAVILTLGLITSVIVSAGLNILKNGEAE